MSDAGRKGTPNPVLDGAVESLVRELGRRRSLAAGAVLFGAGDESREFYRVESGEVRVFRMDAEGREVEIVRLGPGEFFGEAVAFAEAPYPAHAAAVGETVVLAFDRDRLLERAGSDPAAARFFIRLLAEKCLTLNERIEALGMKTVRQRLAHFLIARCPGHGACLVDLEIRKVDLARLLGTAPETLSRTLKKMEADGLLRVDGPRIHILDCPALSSESLI